MLGALILISVLIVLTTALLYRMLALIARSTQVTEHIAKADNLRMEGILRHLLPEEIDALGDLLRAGELRYVDSIVISRDTDGE